MSTTPSETQAILIDLDMLLDTRLAVLSELNFDWVEEHLDKKYRMRLNDVWSDIGEGIDQEKYDAIYAAREKTILSNARLTNMMSMLLGLISNYEDEIALATSPLGQVTLVVNVYPYDLTIEECHRLLQCLTEYLGSIVTIRITKEPMENLSLKYLRQMGYNQMIIYDFISWFNYHYREEKEYPQLPKDHDFIIVTPRLMVNTITPELYEEMKQHNVHKIDCFELLEAICASVFKLIHIPAFYVSVFDTNVDPDIAAGE